MSPCPACPQRQRHRRGRRVLQQAVRYRAGQAPPRLRELRDRRAAAEARPAGEPRPGRHPQPPRRRGSRRTTPSTPSRRAWPRPALPRPMSATPPAATPSRTSSGSRAHRTAGPGDLHGPGRQPDVLRPRPRRPRVLRRRSRQRRWAGRLRDRLLLNRVGSGDGRQAWCQAPDTIGELGQRRVEAGRVATGTGSGTDQCTARASPSSSWARSHTVITKSPSRRISLMCRGRTRGSGRRWRAAAAMAPGSIAAPGCVPADTAGTALARRHSAAARCERAELAVHTNSTRSAARAVGGASESRAPGTSCR